MGVEIKIQKNSIELFVDGTFWMSNYPEEIDDIKRVIKTAKGNCLVGGLGLGLIVQELLKIEIDHIDVVEINPEVIKVCSERVLNEKVKVLEGDAKKVFPNPPYDWVYYDIWILPSL